MKWNYAELSHAAKENGGPAKYVESIKELAKQSNNKKWMNSIIPLLLVLAPFTIKGISEISRKVVNKIQQLRKSKQITAEEAQEAELLLAGYLDTIDSDVQDNFNNTEQK